MHRPGRVNKYSIAAFLLGCAAQFAMFLPAYSQQDVYVQKGEFGATVGFAHYFGDLNHDGRINDPHITIGGYYQKQFTNYTALRISAHYAQLGYSDKFNSKNLFQQKRNLSFNSDIFELALQGDFNFFRFIPTDPDYNFTPYLTFGLGVFSYDPYAYYRGEKVYLRALHTEGQTFYQGRKEYGSTAFCFPMGFGFKYCMSEKINLSLEATYRFTTTDYLDDVSTTYIGVDNFPKGPNGALSLAALLQDRSYETGEIIGIQGRQRGWSKQKDQYMFLELGFSLNLTSYTCPSSSGLY
jgi:hypothetical protein